MGRLAIVGRLTAAMFVAWLTTHALAQAPYTGPPQRQGDSDYGPPRVVDLDQVVFAPEYYQRSHVIVVADLGMLQANQYWTLTQGTGRVLLIPGLAMAADDINPMVGARVEVRGIVRFIRVKEYVNGVDLDVLEDPGLPPLPGPSPTLPRVSITILGLGDREPRESGRSKKAAETMAYEILESPADYLGKTVRIRGQFRGHNLFGDLPAGTERTRDDWVLKDGDRALWVTGKAPRGKGFSLDPAYKGDSVRWLEVAGKPEVVNGIVYLRASKVSLGSPPSTVDDEEAASN
jgi:hypothetical protein